MDALRQLAIVALALGLAAMSSPGRLHWAAVVVLGVLIAALWRLLKRLASAPATLARLTAWMVAFSAGVALDQALAPPGWWAHALLVAIPMALIWHALDGRVRAP